MSAALLWLARHGETDDNRARIFQGQGGAGLNGHGRAQAERLAARLRRAPPAAIVSSDLERAEETARIIADACGLTVELDPDLREVDVGTWTNKSYDEVRARYPEEWAAWEAGLDLRRGGGETYAELAERVGRAVGRIAERHASAAGPVLLVSHGGAIKSWVAGLLELSAVGARALSSVGNCALIVIERDERARHRLRTYNDVAHLEGLAVRAHAD